MEQQGNTKPVIWAGWQTGAQSQDSDMRLHSPAPSITVPQRRHQEPGSERLHRHRGPQPRAAATGEVRPVISIPALGTIATPLCSSETGIATGLASIDCGSFWLSPVRVGPQFVLTLAVCCLQSAVLSHDPGRRSSPLPVGTSHMGQRIAFLMGAHPLGCW